MKRVFKWLTEEGGDPRASIYADWFSRMFKPKDFLGINKLMMSFIIYCSKLSIAPKKMFLEAYLRVDGKEDVKKYNIKTDTMTSYDYKEISQLEEAYKIISSMAITTYDDYVSVDLTEHDFKVDMYDFMKKMRSELIADAMMKSYPRLTDGSDVGEVSEELRNELASFDEIYDTTKIKDVDFINKEGDEDDEMVFLAKTGLPCIDGDIGGIYTRIIYTLTSQPKGGKTRMACVHWIYQILTVAKMDVILYELELTKSQIKNILIAYHITRLYGGRIKIPDSIMNKKKEMTAEQLQIYESAKIDLFESGKYGELVIKEELIVEKYRDEAMGLAKASGNLGLIVVDYMGLAESEPQSRWDARKEQYKIITDAYEITRKLVKKLNVAALCVNQYNDKGIDAAYAGKAIRSGYIQGGHIVIRHTDYDLHLTFTEEQELAQVRSFTAGYVRGAAGFKDVLLSTDLSVSIFRQELMK